MDEPSIPHAPDADQPGDATPRERFPWQTAIRCLFLAAILAVIAAVSWRPAVLRFSLLLSMVSPSRGDDLAWRPDDDAPPPPRQRKGAPSPAEWRLTAAHIQPWQTHAAADLLPHWQGGPIPARSWQRSSMDPWQWQDDAAPARRRRDDAAPAQKPATAFRADDTDAWAPIQAIQIPNTTTLTPTPTPDPTPAPVATPTATATAELAPLPRIEPPPSVPAAPAAPAEPEPIDWTSREITGRIPGAYLTIYPKLRFVGLCVPGQGYIRKYNQVGVPRDTETKPKTAADDGRTPYGKYYVAGRERDAAGPRLLLSWPSPDDLRRLGADADTVTAVEMAWLDKILPPQTTRAGGGLAIAGLNGGQTTEGGFALERPQLEEIDAALPEGAWVFIQE